MRKTGIKPQKPEDTDRVENKKFTKNRKKTGKNACV